MENKQPQPPATEEWTVHWSKELDCHVVSINDATKALAAQKKYYETVRYRALIEHEAQLADELAAEREKHANELTALVREVLQAQAAIAEHNAKVHPQSTLRITVDLSALDKFVSDKTKPLVDLLRKCVPHPKSDLTSEQLADALAKVKP